ncbi:hypothetical protein U1Q18_027089, partial [Sarracenia purpurea var. burkii]
IAIAALSKEVKLVFGSDGLVLVHAAFFPLMSSPEHCFVFGFMRSQTSILRTHACL